MPGHSARNARSELGVNLVGYATLNGSEVRKILSVISMYMINMNCII